MPAMSAMSAMPAGGSLSRRRSLGFLAAGFGLLSGAVALAAIAPAGGAIDPERALSLSQSAIGRQLGDYRLTDQFGRPLELARLRGQPLIIHFVYTSCAYVCPALTTRLGAVAKVARAALGDDSFSIVTVGFDTRIDTVEQMRRFARARGIDLPGWYFAAADQATVDRLAADTGFVYAPVAGGYDHFSQLTIVDATGRVFRQVYGADFEPPLIVEPLKSILLGSAAGVRPAAGWLRAVRLICTSYDPKSGRYRFDYSLILEILIGVTCTLAVGIFLLRAWNQPRAPDAAP
jgi:protein SCO1/2